MTDVVGKAFLTIDIHLGLARRRYQRVLCCTEPSGSEAHEPLGSDVRWILKERTICGAGACDSSRCSGPHSHT